ERSPSGPGPNRLYAATLRIVRRPERPGESRSLCLVARVERARTGTAISAADGNDGTRSVRQATGGAAFRRHEAKARARLRAGLLAEIGGARRTDCRRRSAIAPRVVGNHPASRERRAH